MPAAELEEREPRVEEDVEFLDADAEHARHDEVSQFVNPHEDREAEEELEDFDQYVHVAGADLQVEESGGQRAGLVVGCGVVVERRCGDECGVPQGIFDGAHDV